MSVNRSAAKWVRLGDYIEELDVRNSDNKIKKVKSVSVSKEFKETNAKVNKEELQGYKLVPPYHLSYVQTTKNEKCFANALNTSSYTYVVTQVNKVLYVKNPEVLNIEYLSIIFKNEEFDRYAIFNSWGSARETFDWSVLCDTLIPLPDIEIQQELVDTYNGLKALAEQNEALIKPLTEACQAYIVDCKKKYPEVELGGYIEECIEKNRDLKFESKDARGVYSNGTFGDTLANLEGSNLTSYKVVKTDEFAYSNRINIGSIAQNNEKDVIVSPSYTVFRVKSEEIIPKYLFILLRRNEFLRSTLFFAIGTIKDDFSYDRMTEVKIPLLPIEVQQTILNLYNCAEEAKKIATEAREKMKTLCPALVQKAIYS
jgi:type I restriction enzyme S subunit